MTHYTARLISIIGHPAVLMAAAAVVASPAVNAFLTVTLTIACGLVALAYSYYKTKRGDWSHIDASGASERTQLSTRVGLGLVIFAGLLALTDIHIGVSVVVALSGLVLLAGYVLRRFAKLSLHVAFATFAALIVWPHHTLTAAFLSIAIAVGWSRIALRRHVGRDLVLGALVGSLAGLVFQVVRISLDA